MDRCQLPHSCLPLDRYDDKADRPGKSEERSCENSLVKNTTTEEEHLRAASAQKRTVQMDSIPENLSQLPDGENFLQLQNSDTHLYYSEEVTAMACDNGLSALIGDGIHKLNPVTIPDRMDKGQLYTIHAVIRGGVEIPILYAITRHKNIATYRTIFRRLRKIIAERPGLRIVLDFEKVATRVAMEAFDEGTVEGCAFQLAQAWNRMS
ncbi:hypothetical protein ANCCAN_02404 [Ancylostoma caninum]|uniref:MULE transposase domain-containing protein n=1 Tax=Ancylostoma caninum TaxID=29170 RepID=A0A368H4B6_ANCCA|nr:hypothetical protein ANCCAN_02404 [Ancylostoma caninum]